MNKREALIMALECAINVIDAEVSGVTEITPLDDLEEGDAEKVQRELEAIQASLQKRLVRLTGL